VPFPKEGSESQEEAERFQRQALEAGPEGLMAKALEAPYTAGQRGSNWLKLDEWTVYVRPNLVVEVAFSDIQASPRYPAGMAFRFARVKRYRPDKRATEADTLPTVMEIFRRQSNGIRNRITGQGIVRLRSKKGLLLNLPFRKEDFLPFFEGHLDLVPRKALGHHSQPKLGMID
jgi:hypothetical protein